MENESKGHLMSATILPLPGFRAPLQPIAHFIRIGHAGLKFDDLLARGRFPVVRVVVEASTLRFQKNLLNSLKANGVEIVLDTNVAELSEIGKFDGWAKTAPWGQIGDGGPLCPEHFRGTHPSDLIGMIARTAVEFGVNAVLAGGHFLRLGSSDGWFGVDRDACQRLRRSLDQEGGGHIAIDYSLVLGYGHLRDEAVRGYFVSKLQDLPFENLWLRVSGFGADATAAGTKRYLTSVSNIHNVGKPIVADSLGGLVGLASLAFGAVSGISHGVGENERLDAAGWNKPKKERDEKGGGGRTTRVGIFGLGKSLTKDELQAIARTPTGHRLVACSDRNCCPHGISDMIKNWRAHNLHQMTERTKRLEAVPDQRRARHFLDNDLADTARIAHQIASLNLPDEGLSERLSKHSHRVDNMRAAMSDLHEIRGEVAPRAAAVAERVHRQSSASQGTIK
jgi:hypothetical protein